MWNWTAEFDRTGCVKIYCGGNAMILPKIPPIRGNGSSWSNLVTEIMWVAPLGLTAIKWPQRNLSRWQFKVLPNTHSTSNKIGKRKINPGGRVKYFGACGGWSRYLIWLVWSDTFWTYPVSSVLVYWCIYLKLNLQYFLTKWAFYTVKNIEKIRYSDFTATFSG